MLDSPSSMHLSFQTPLPCPSPPNSSSSRPGWGTRRSFPADGSRPRGKRPPLPATSSGPLWPTPCSSSAGQRSGRRRSLWVGWRFLRRAWAQVTALWSSETFRSETRGDTRASWWWTERGPQKPRSSFRASSWLCMVSVVLFFHFTLALLSWVYCH